MCISVINVHTAEAHTEFEKQILKQCVALLGDNGVQRSACIWPDALSHPVVKRSINDSVMQFVCTILPHNPTRDLAKAVFAD